MIVTIFTIDINDGLKITANKQFQYLLQLSNNMDGPQDQSPP